MSRRQRKTERILCTAEQWLNAKTRVEAGESKRAVAKSLGMHEATLRKRLKRSSPALSLGRYLQTFSDEMETELCNYIKKVDNMFYGLTPQKIREIAYDFAVKNGLEHRFNQEKKMAGTEWLGFFLKRHPDLSLRAPTSAERGVNVTLVNAVNAAGNFIPPAFIFPRKRMKAELLDGAAPSSIGMVSDSSFINSTLFLDWLSHFKDHAKPSKDNPVLLILDNHTSHCTLNAVHFFRENHIHALTIPPHSSHKTQPLDRCIHNSLKIFYASECEKWMRNHPGRVITVYQIAQILTPAYLKAATPANAIQSFKISGIQPLNPDIFGEEDFLASAVTERPLIESLDTQISQSGDNLPLPLPEFREEQVAQSADNQVENVLLADPNEVGISQPATDLIQNVDLENKAPRISPQPSCSTNYVSVQPLIEIARARTPLACLPIQSIESPHVPLEDITPLPRAEIFSRSNRKRAKSDILSGSPYKLALEESLASKKVPKNIPKSVQKLASKSFPKKAKKSFKVPNNTPKKKVWRCPACTEIYIEPPAEDWIGCSKCSEWWHEACTAYEGQGNFICRLCK